MLEAQASHDNLSEQIATHEAELEDIGDINDTVRQKDAKEKEIRENKLKLQDLRVCLFNSTFSLAF